MFPVVGEAELEHELRQPVAAGERGYAGISQHSHVWEPGAGGGGERLSGAFFC